MEFCNFVKEVEERYGEFREKEPACSEETRRRLARIGKAMLHHVDHLQRKKKQEKKNKK
ncbi:hypothetical protein [Bacteroides sp.]